MDINVLRTVVTVVVFAAFIGIVCWAYAPSRRARFERDAMLPFDEVNTAEHDGAQQ
jgi:cytochrome c oxidase cbb3-type subunit 4